MPRDRAKEPIQGAAWAILEPSVTYAIQDGNAVKIGVANDIRNRMGRYRTHNLRAKLIKTWPGDAYLEQEMHNSLSFCRIPGTEWFRI
jgi:hypothetical protein